MKVSIHICLAFLAMATAHFTHMIIPEVRKEHADHIDIDSDFPASSDSGLNRPHYTYPSARAAPRIDAPSAIASVRNILTGVTGIHDTCERCISAMQVGQTLAQQNPAAFSSGVVGLCNAVRFKPTGSACSSAYGPAQVAPYISTLANANILRDGKSFCKSYFNVC